MTTFFHEIGFIAYPLSILAVFLVVQIGRAILDVARSRVDGGATLRIHSIMVLGVLGACLGVLGTLIGLTMAAAFIEQAGAVSTGLVWGGVRVALGSSIVGFLMLGFASIVWLVLQYVRGRQEPAVR